MIGAKSDVEYVILQILSHNLLADRIIHNTTPTQIRLIVSLTKIIIIHSIFLFDDFRNNILRGSRYTHYLSPLVLKDILNNDAAITLIFLPNFLTREILENSAR